MQQQQQQPNGYGTPQPRKGAWNPPSAYRPALHPRPNSHAPNRHSSQGNNRFDQQHKQQQRYHKEHAGAPNLNHKPGLYIRYAELSIRRAFVASVDPGVSWSTTLLKFQPVFGNNLAHLSGESLHSLALHHNSEKMRERTAELYTQAVDEKYCPPTSLSAQEVADSVIDNLYADMSVAMDHVRSYLESRFWIGVKPKLWLRFGKIVFHSRQNRTNLADHKPFDAEGLERALHGPKHEDSSVLKTFDAGVSHDYFRKIRALVGDEELGVPETKEKFIIQLTDATQPRTTLVCTCKRILPSNEPRLTLCKANSMVVFWFVDISRDCNLSVPFSGISFVVVRALKELTEHLAEKFRMDMERSRIKGDISALRTIVDKAVYDVKAEGGLSWPLGSTSSGPYTVTGASHVMQTNIKSQGCKWKLRHANRTALTASAGRFSFEIDVTVDEWADQFQVWKDLYENESTKENCQYVDCFFKPLSTLFSWVWGNCI